MPNLIIHAKANTPTATAVWNGVEYPALVGRNGAIVDKKEGDSCAPVGRWPILLGFYRADRVARPSTEFPWRIIQEGDAYSDDPADPMYNHLVGPGHPRLSTGTLWKEGPEYDVLFFLGYNIAPVVPGKGSAILLHGWREGAVHSGGCVVVPNALLREIAPSIRPGDYVDVRLT